ncbi:desmoglein-2-like isoform X2 [Melanotaenia boesemani]|uniref:desmoglein-2-like isoform X2 n=1 Tax=Melanotaenia boesemani TaxID=1250792 RepID=UPI001C0561AA|nr:desmoglein-2-like isoform X2 [Melanotaenia boesemani]
MASLLTFRLFVLTAFLLILVLVSGEGNGRTLQRQKREWFLAPRRLKENQDYTTYDYIAKIRSDKENFTSIMYSITGPGVDEPPFGRFSVDQRTGYVKVHTILDREDIPVYQLKGIAKFFNGSSAENDTDLVIKVEDENDCKPVIKIAQVGFVNESSSTGTVVMKVTATDDDEENTLSSAISYRIESQSNIAEMFYINPKTGEVIVQKNTLDREKQDIYKLKIIASDLDGRPGGNTGTGEIEIKILDINDNIPTLERESYEGSVEENMVNVEVLRIKAIDMDLIYTENWQAVYTIVSGNEGGHFTITTDSKTNEGIITINKALDYEEVKMLNLAVKVSNKAEYNFGSGVVVGTPSKSYPIKINVINQKEGPRFQPSVKVVTVSEDHTSIFINKVITTYAAIDSDTLKTATNVRYAKIDDKGNWLTIDEKTAEIKLNTLPDRESKFLINGTYYAKIICVTNEAPSKTATGTIAIQVEDFNDHCPELTSTTQSMCLEENAIYISAVDKDYFPNAAPLDFTVIQKGSEQKWTVEPFNETTVILRDQARLWPGIYKVALEIKDQQGKSCANVQIVDVTVCTCLQNTKTCVGRSNKTAVFGAAGVLLLLLGLLLLLLVPLLLLFCLCGVAPGDFKPIPFDTKQQLIAYHTEGQGEDKEVPLLQVPVMVESGTLNTKDINNYGGKGYLGGLVESGGEALGGAINMSTVTAENMHLYNQYGHFSRQEGMEFMDGGMMAGQDMGFSRYTGGAFSGMALSDHFLGEYFLTKSNNASQQSQEKDTLLVYDYEGQESLAGSVGCCSLLDNEDDLTFLNDLGPKFKTLAEICHGSTLESESGIGGISKPPVRPVSPAVPSTSTHTHAHTHSETVRDRDRVNTLNTSNVASGSSTFIQEERITKRSQGSAATSNVHVQDKIIIPNQTLLIQQPAMYYAATPMYVVESKPQMVLMTGGAQQAVGQMGLSQGMVQVGGLQHPHGMVLVEGKVGMSGATGQAAQGLSLGSGSRSTQMLVAENGSSGREQGFVQIEKRSTESDFDMRGQGVQVKSFSHGSHSSTGLNEESTLIAAPKLQGSQRVVVQHKKVLVTERGFES